MIAGIRVGPLTYSVCEDDEKILLMEKAGHGVHGYTDHGSQEIVIDPRNGEGIQRLTVLHEALHCVWVDAGMRDVPAEERLEELVVAHLAPRLLSLLDDNPALVKYLLGAE